MFTLVGGGMKSLQDTVQPMEKVLPSKAEWIQEAVVTIDPRQNCAVTCSGLRINYEYLVVAAGLTLHYEKVRWSFR